MKSQGTYPNITFKNRRIRKNACGREFCEAATGVDYSGSNPRVILCRKPATMIFFGTKQPTCRLGMVCCDDCYAKLDADDPQEKTP